MTMTDDEAFMFDRMRDALNLRDGLTSCSLCGMPSQFLPLCGDCYRVLEALPEVPDDERVRLREVVSIIVRAIAEGDTIRLTVNKPRPIKRNR
jgi:hypothetical protein